MTGQSRHEINAIAYKRYALMWHIHALCMQGVHVRLECKGVSVQTVRWYTIFEKTLPVPASYIQCPILLPRSPVVQLLLKSKKPRWLHPIQRANSRSWRLHRTLRQVPVKLPTSLGALSPLPTCLEPPNLLPLWWVFTFKKLCVLLKSSKACTCMSWSVLNNVQSVIVVGEWILAY